MNSPRMDDDTLTTSIYDAIAAAHTSDQIHQVLIHDIPHCIGISDDERTALVDAAVVKFKEICPPSGFNRRQREPGRTLGHD